MNENEMEIPQHSLPFPSIAKLGEEKKRGKKRKKRNTFPLLSLWTWYLNLDFKYPKKKTKKNMYILDALSISII